MTSVLSMDRPHARPLFGAVTPTSLLMILAVFLLVFLPNRFNVGFGWEAGGWDFFPTDVLVPLLLVLVALVRTQSDTGVSRRTRPSLTILVFLWFLSGVVPTIWSDARAVSVEQGLYALLAIGLWTLPILIVPNLRLSRQEIALILAVFGGLAVFGSLLALLQSLAPRFIYELMGWKFVVVSLDSERRGVLPLGPASVIGAYYAMVIPLAYVMLVSARSGWARTGGGVVIILLGLGCLFTSSRSTFGLLVLVLLGCFFWIRTERSSWLIPLVAIALLAVVLAFLLVSLNFERLGTLQDASTAWRWRGIEVAGEMIRDKPILGHGTESNFHRQEGTFRTAFVGSKAHEAILYNGRVAPYEPHNLYLFMAAERGLLGLGVFLLLYAVLVRWMYQYQAQAATASDQLWMRAFGIGLVAVAIHSMTGSDLIRQARLTPLFWIYAGLAICLGRLTLTEKLTQRVQGRGSDAV